MYHRPISLLWCWEFLLLWLSKSEVNFGMFCFELYVTIYAITIVVYGTISQIFSLIKSRQTTSNKLNFSSFSFILYAIFLLLFGNFSGIFFSGAWICLDLKEFRLFDVHPTKKHFLITCLLDVLIIYLLAYLEK